VLEIKDLAVSYGATKGGRLGGDPVRAVDGVSLSIGRGEIVALVGESGSGKTSTVMAALRLVEPVAGSICFEGFDITHASERRIRPLRRRMQMIYQDPYDSLDPRFSVRRTIAEPLLVHRIGAKHERNDRVVAALERVGLSPAELFVDRRPHELSGGQRQRVAMAACLVVEPSLLIADEPVSMLDVSVRAGILSLLCDQQRLGLSVLMITHDLSTAAQYADRIAVMYLGRIVEEGETRSVIEQPRHPYTEALLSVVPRRDPREQPEQQILVGEIPDPRAIPSGCRFHPRCPLAIDVCRRQDPYLEPALSPGGAAAHNVACLLRTAQGQVTQEEELGVG
jgi:peptide/nickel transport system ATP-binding protein